MPTNVRDLIAAHEGRRDTPYLDTNGKWTVGIGRNLERVPFSQDELALINKNDASRSGKPWGAWKFTDDEIDLMFENDLSRTQKGLRFALPWFGGLNAPRQAALMDMAFNMGVEGLLKFRNMILHAQYGEWLSVANDALDSRWADQVSKRAQTDAEILRTGEWQ